MNGTQELNVELNAAGGRQEFLKKAGLASGAALLALMATTANPLGSGAAFARTELAGLSDVDILNFALSLEHLESEFYRQVVTGGKFTGFALNVLTQIHNHEVAHVAGLTAAIKSLGGTPVAKQATYNFGDMSTAAAILATAETLEGVGVGAYTGAAPLLTNRAGLLPTAASIEQVEARHYATIRALRDENPAPAAFGPSLSVAQVQAATKPIFG